MSVRKLTVRHLTHYTYSDPVVYTIQSLRLFPLDFDGQKILSWSITDNWNSLFAAGSDGYGNMVHARTINRPHDHITITVEGTAIIEDRNGIVAGLDEPLPPGFFLRPTDATAMCAPLQDLLDETRPSHSVAGLHALSAAIRDKVDYVVGTTKVHTTAAETLELGTGVCQDHAHIFIAACRHLAIPARYVGGYLYTGDDSLMHEASHAWAEAYIDDLGWVGFDISNRVSPDSNYIRLAHGLDYWATAPIRGIRRGLGEEDLSVELQIRQMQQ